MEFEDALKRLKLQAPSEGARDRVLGAARSARFERRVWRWTAVAAAVVLGVTIPINLAVERPSPPAADHAASRAVERCVSPEGDPGLRGRLRMALSAPQQPRMTWRDVR